MPHIHNPHFLNRTGYLTVRSVTGIAAAAIAVLMVSEFLVKITVATRPALDNQAALVTFAGQTTTQTLLTVMIDTLLMAALVIFFAGFRQLTIERKPNLNWVASLAFGAGLIFVTTTLVGDAMDAGAALDAWGGHGDPSVIRALIEGHLLLFGSIGCVLIALVTSSFAYTTFSSKVVPAWTGWVAYIVAGLNVLVLPTLFGGTDATSFFSAGGLGVTLFATFPFLAWVVAVGIVTIRNR